MLRKLFTERVAQPEPRVKETLDGAVLVALLQLVVQRIEDSSFGMAFPETCPDGNVNAGASVARLRDVMNGYRVIWPQDALLMGVNRPTDHQVYDLLEFSYEHIAIPIPTGTHPFFQHHHLRSGCWPGAVRR